MVYRLTQENMSEALDEQVQRFYQAFHEVHISKHPNANQQRLPLAHRFGCGYMDIRQFSGITYSHMALQFNEDVQLAEAALDSGFYIGLNLGSGVEFAIEGSKHRLLNPCNTVSLGYCQAGERLHTAVSRCDKVCSISFFLDEGLVRGYLRSFGKEDLLGQLKGHKTTRVLKQASLLPRHRQLVAKLLDNPHSGLAEKLFFDSAAAELLLAVFESICTHKRSQQKLTSRDKERLMAAKNRLLHDIHNPPSIAELASFIGLNEDKLKKGFKVLFNNTIYQTLLEHKMQLAVELVRRRDISIAEVAYESGYTNVSKFILAFKKQYGVTPGAMRKEIHYFLPSTKVIETV